LDVLRANFLKALGDIAVLRHGIEQTARFLWLEIEAVVFACRRICVTVSLGKKVLRLDSVNDREGEQIALTGVSGERALESFLPHPSVRICGNEAALADHVERA